MTRLEKFVLGLRVNVPSYPDDVTRLCDVVHAKTGSRPPPWLMDEIWSRYSDERCAQWMGLPRSDDEVWSELIEFGFPHDEYYNWYDTY